MSDTPREPSGRAYRLTVLLGLFASAATWIWLALTAPDRVPTHWSGETPDGWSSKPAALAICGLLLPGVALGISQLSRLATAWPESINVPHKQWWLAEPRRLVRFERLLREDMLLIAASLLGLSALMNVTIGIAAHRPDGAMPTAVFAAAMVLVLGSVLAVVTRMLLGRYDPTDDL
ncbi:DUF1648 domain-containing protein [Calidifontibacter indicus]|uniref:Uncharacterized protein DUF1648 n=1 Tax=Calidifontibacter indicus TaxID=419650 RepID=A0A3D9UMT8_9MICO|nr:DUF1648 domain-containing protein [Calidifontibacter indicus]REF29300.1 uncharacterized protein DUF1648 [Calidifontibacter indicus]